MSRPPFSLQALDHIVLRVPDIAKAEAFYTRVLGAVEERRVALARLVQLRAGQSLIDLIDQGAEGIAPERSSRELDHFAIRIEPFDEEQIRLHLAAHGVDIVEHGNRYGAQGNGPSIYITDPFGTVVELKGPALPVESATPLLRTRRLVLRPTRMSDAAALLPLFMDQETMRYWSHSPIAHTAEMEGIIARNLPPQNRAESSFVLTLDGGRAFGCINIHNEDEGMAGLGYITDKAFWGQGYTSEAVQAVIRHAFDTLKLNRLWLEMDPGNAGSARVAAKCGFTPEGVQRKSYLMNGTYFDTANFGLLYEDWFRTCGADLTSG